jgi:hypothetical protein
MNDFQQITCLGLDPEITQKESHQRASIQHIAKLLRRCDLRRVRTIITMRREKRRTNTECVRDARTAEYHVTFRGGTSTAQRAQDNSKLFTDPIVLLRIIEPRVLREVPEEIGVEFADRLHLVVRHSQRRVDSRWRSQQVVHNSQLTCRPGGMEETQDEQGNSVSGK